MYIQKVHIENIKSISQFEMEFKKPAGWHVLIGDNGSGKSSIVRAIALAIIGHDEALGLRTTWSDYLNRQSNDGKIRIDLIKHDIDKHTGRQAKLKNWLIPNILILKRKDGLVNLSVGKTKPNNIDPFKYNWGHGKGWFSVAYGPFRRFAGGNQDWQKIFYSQLKFGAHLSAFGEDIALTETI